MIPVQYRPRHNPGCTCVVCWTNDFHREMTLRNESRATRCCQILANPEAALPVQSNFFMQLDEVSQ
ncbi:hypothetical protein SAMN05216198_0111 [Halopseudomonas litoralis]|uniref:Uncharacterized protein n=1 Tax=Halopseudomonas litoralis TaxID=797277 RepID=A0A1H1L6J8_9GAMM|nr:hypothetical protein SAMN05216198_0111 [Halopseudomonas litoralis]